MVPNEPCYIWRDGELELWLPDTPLGRIIAERLQREEGAERISDPKNPARNGNGHRRAATAHEDTSLITK